MNFIVIVLIGKVGDVRVRFSFAGLSGETPRLGPPQTVSTSDDRLQYRSLLYSSIDSIVNTMYGRDWALLTSTLDIVDW